MDLPKVIKDLIKAQDNFDSVTYSTCFSDTAIVFDEGHDHKGRKEIAEWIDKANKKYKTVLSPTDYKVTGSKSVLSTKVSGDFDGSPTTMEYHLEIIDGLIQSLKIK